MLSKLSYINLVIREVLPTLCSPRNTSLNFLKGFPKSPDVAMVVVTIETAGKMRINGITVSERIKATLTMGLTRASL